MATWKGKPHTYILEVVNNQGYLDYGKVEFKWEYSTCSDTISIIKTEEGKESTFDLLGKEYAIAQMETLLDWFSAYEGVGKLEALVANIKEAKK